MRILVILILFLFPLTLQAAITGSLSHNPIYLHESTNLLINLEEAGEGTLRFPLHTADYDVVARQSSSNITIINNKFMQSKQLAYTLRFRRAGLFTLPIKNSDEPNALLQIKVIDSGNASNNSTAMNNGRVSQSETPFAVISVNKNTPYLNEQIILKLKIYHRGTLRQIQLPDLDLSSFIHKRAEKSKEYTENFNGENYLVYELSYTLYPIKIGSLNIPAKDVLVTVLRENDNNFDPFDPFSSFNRAFSVETEKALKTNALNILVKSLPQPSPAGFNGYVGRLSISNKLAKSTVVNGEPFNIFTEVSGDGNPNNLNFKTLFSKTNEYSVYQDRQKKQGYFKEAKENFRISVTNALISSVSRDKLTIKTNPVVSFNPETGSYESKAGEEFLVDIMLKGTPAANNSSVALSEPHSSRINEQKNIKRLSHIKAGSIEKQAFRQFPLGLYLIILLIINLVAYSKDIFNSIAGKIRQKSFEEFPFKEYEKVIQKSISVSEISNKIKSLYAQIDSKCSWERKLLALDPELFEEFNRFIENTDRINYGIKGNLDGELVSRDLKERALWILRGLKRLYG